MEIERGLVVREVFNKCCIADIALQAAMRAVYSHLDLLVLRSACCLLSGPAGVAGGPDWNLTFVLNSLQLLCMDKELL